MLKLKGMNNIEDIIYSFVSKHEILVDDKYQKKNKRTKFTTFGNFANRNSIREILEILDEETKSKVVEMMNNKRIK